MTAESYDPELYARVHDGVGGDLDFYLARTRGSESVLELGCGFGRVAIALAEAGVPRVVGLDRDPAMLDAARRRARDLDETTRARLDWVVGDMGDFELGERFDRIIVPFTGLFCLPSEEALLGCFRSIRKHLGENGELIFDAYCPDVFHREASPEDHPEDQLDEVAQFEYEGSQLTVFERSRWDKEEQKVVATYEHKRDDGTLVHVGEIVHRYVLSDQLPAALAAAGLRIERFEGSFEGIPFTEECPMVVTAVAVDNR